MSQAPSSVKQGAAQYVYGVVPARVAVPGRRGIAKKPLHTLADEDIAAIVSEAPDGAEMRAGREELTAHAAVLESALNAFDGFDVLAISFAVPLRFQWFGPDDPMASLKSDSCSEAIKSLAPGISGKRA